MSAPIPMPTVKPVRHDHGGGRKRGEVREMDPLPGIPVVEEDRLCRYAVSLGEDTMAQILALYADCLVETGGALALALTTGDVDQIRHQAYRLTGAALEMGNPRLAHVARFLARRADQGVAEAGSGQSLDVVLAVTRAAVAEALERHAGSGMPPMVARA